jgi:hypothetical protein
MSFKQHVDETFTEAWEHYHGFMTDLPTACMKKLRILLWVLLQAGIHPGILQWVVTRS